MPPRKRGNIKREKLINDLIEPVQELLVILYGSVEGFVSAKNVHALEPYILRYEKNCGYRDQVELQMNEMNLKILTDDPAVEMYSYLEYYVNNLDEFKALDL